MKSLYKTVLAAYLLFLLWLVLFKTSLSIGSVVADYQSRGFNLLPFAGYANGKREMLDNLIVFVPIGLLLSVNFKQVTFSRKLEFMFLLSVAAELTQFVLAIGTTDITDVIMNTLGGLLGLVLYRANSAWANEEKFDRFVVAVLTVLLGVLLVFRFFFLRVKY